MSFFFFQAEDGIRDLVRSRGLGDVYKRQIHTRHILIKPKITEDDIALAKHRLDTIVGLLNKDSIDFSKAVKLYLSLIHI